jgi:hypothetical protein
MTGRWLASALVAVTLSACGGAAPKASGNSSPATSVSASSSSGLACRLPLLQFTPGSGKQTPGFITFPGGSFQADPSAAFVQVDSARSRSVVRPYLYGDGGPGSYDWVARRWLPNGAVSQDGLRYAYTVPFSRVIHIVEIATGGDRSLAAPDGPDNILYYAKEGVYFNQDWEAASLGLWLLDPSTGAVQTVMTDRHVAVLGGYAAWLTDRNPADAHPVPDPHSGGYLDNEVLRRDMNGGGTVQWFYRPGKTIGVVGLSQDKKPLIEVDSADPNAARELWIVPAANQGTLLATGKFGRLAADSHGIWIDDGSGISLSTSTGLHSVSNVSGTPVGGCG